jgi:hypothetical protein
VSDRLRYRVRVWPWTRGLGRRLMPNWLAVTLGRTIVSWRDMNDAELEHELEHVRQWARLGWRLPIAYLAESIRARRRGGHWYRDNRFEADARAAAADLGRRRTTA